MNSGQPGSSEKMDVAAERAAVVVASPTVTLNPTGDAPLAALVEFETNDTTKAALTVSDGSETRTIYFDDFATDHALPLFGLKPDTAYTIDVAYTGSDGVTEVAASDLEVTTDPLPDDFPISATLASEPDRMEPGFTMAFTGAYAVIFDEAGDVAWYTGTLPMRNFKQLSPGEFGGAYDGQIMWLPQQPGYTISDLLGNELKHADIKNIGDLEPLHHELWLTEAGTLMTLGRIEVDVDNYPTSETDPTPRQETTVIEDEPLIEFDADGNILNVRNFSDLLDPTRTGYGGFINFQNAVGLDWIHNNAIITDPRDGTVIVSSRHQDAVIKFDLGTGELKWILGTHENWPQEFQPYLLEPVGVPFEWQYHQHAMEITADGNLLLFDNGNERASPYDGTDPVPPEENYSRAVKYAIDEDKMEVSQVWEYVPDPSIYSFAVGDADEQPTTGNVLVNFGVVSHVDGVSSADLGKGESHVRIIEVTQEETPVFDLEIRLPDPEALAINYRAERLASLYPSDVSVFQLVAGDGGDNRLDGANRDDEIRGLGGADTLVAADGNDSLLGQDDDDLLLGGDGDDTLVGGDGDDTLDGNYGYDSLDGGDGFDTADYSFWIYPIEIDLSNGRADLQVGVTPETLVSMEGAVTGDGNDTLIGNEEDNVLAGGAGSDRIVGGDGNDSLVGDDGTDTLVGDTGNDELHGGNDNDSLDGGAGDDLLRGNSGNDALESGGGDDSLYGDDDDDGLKGGSGDDLLSGGDGHDTLAGGSGNDTLDGNLGYDELNGGDGSDMADYSFWDHAIRIDLSAGLAELLVSTPAERLINIEGAITAGGNDTLVGNGKSNIFEGGAGSDSITGAGGNDLLMGQDGNDLLAGGGGEDTFVASLGDDTITDFMPGQDVLDLWSFVGVAGSWATLQGILTLTNNDNDTEIDFGFGNKVTLVGVHKDTLDVGDFLGVAPGAYVQGDGVVNGLETDDILAGGGDSDTLTAGAGDDTVLAGGGDDRIVAASGAGNDDYRGEDGDDTIGFASATKPVTVDLATGRASGKEIGKDTITDVEHAEGGDGNDKLTGDDEGNRLSGGLGNDTLDGGGGDDELTGGPGKDVLTGGEGEDSFVFESLTDSGVGNNLRDTLEDFDPLEDKIDLPGDFDYIGGAAFTGGGGEVRFHNGALRMDEDGGLEPEADMEIALAKVKLDDLGGDPDPAWLI